MALLTPAGAVLFGLILFGAAAPTRASFEPVHEYQVKAGYLASLFSYVEWPLPQTAGKTVCVLGHDPFGQALEDIVEQYKGVSVRRMGEGQSLKGCNLLFVAHGGVRRALPVIEQALRTGILTVGESQEAGAGKLLVLLETSERDRRVHVGIRVAEATRWGFRFSSRLLAIANLIKEGKEE